MNREIKFRAWDKKNNCWLTDKDNVYLSEEGEAFLLARGAASDYLSRVDVDVVFWTGLLDKNGKEIYESDKVKRRVWLVGGEDYMDYICNIAWNGWCYGLFVGEKQLWALDPIIAKEIEIIGNIYES